ncbi:MAG TPA: ComEA family DNA-binding protein [Syntrophomonas sp.]|nr:ComEA family DNA-binding protein [Syntrophomonas sp.]HRW13094.1 ComEA family DNA-binding protein [Syntrophomonas sp.]
MGNIDRRYLLAALVLIAVMVFFAGTRYAEMKQNTVMEEDLAVQPSTGQEEQANEEELQVYVCGEVEKPGLYKLKAGARVYDALQIAGILPGAALDYAQPARRLQDGETVELYSEAELAEQLAVRQLSPTEALPVVAGIAPASPAGSLVNINTATVQELDDRLPGVGPAIAQRIVDYRESNGGFARIEDLQNVNGIGDKKYSDIKAMITVR